MGVSERPADLLAELARGHLTAGFFPLSHPTAERVMRAIERGLRDAPAPLSLTVEGGGLRLGDETDVLRYPHAAAFAAALDAHGVRRLEMPPGLSAAAVGRLLAGIALAPEVAAAAGGLRVALEAAGAGGVVVDRERVPSRPHALAEGADPTSLWRAPDVFGETRPGEEPGEAPEALLQQLRAAGGAAAPELLYRIEVSARDAGRTGSVGNWIETVRQLRREAEQAGTADPVWRAVAMNALARAASRPVIEVLVARLGAARGEDERAEQRSTLVHIGGESVPPLLRALASEQDRLARRTIRDTLVELDRVGVPLAEDPVGDERWFLVRNMVGILGETRGAHALDHLERTAQHPDPRVRRETAYALAKFEDQRAVATLIGLCSDDAAAVRGAAVLGLGLSGSREAVRPLLERLEAERDGGVETEVVRALGRLGDLRAIDALAERTERGGLFSRRPRELRVEAMLALGAVGGARAAGLLRELADDRDAGIRDAAKQALSQAGPARMEEADGS
ncbi:MAG: HEAT repeat domain-containing protein [Longimicrobiaceae bacterium]